MIVLLPPSETKRAGGPAGSRLDLGALAFPALTGGRRAALAALAELVRDPIAARRALKLSGRQAGEVDVDRAVESSPTMPAIDRFDGVLFDALDAASLPDSARRRAGESVVVASALFGVVSALDPIPAYRLSADSRLPGLPLRRHWAPAVTAELEAIDGFVLDARSEAYAALGPAPAGSSRFLRVVTRDAAGTRRALNHFNKAAKGRLVRRLLTSTAWPGSLDDLRDWARDEGAELADGAPGELELVVES